MKNKLKTILLTAGMLLLTPSCASIYRGVGTFEPCLPRDKEDINLKERIKNYVAEPDGTYNIKFKINPYSKDRQLKFERKFMEF